MKDKRPQPDRQKLADEKISVMIEDIQIDLRSYIISLTGHSSDCDDILQETSIYLWKERAKFKAGTNFKAWAFKVAYFKTKANNRDRARKGEVVMSDLLVQRISNMPAEQNNSRSSSKLTALSICLKMLRPHELKILEAKYIKKLQLTIFSKQTGKSVDAIHQSISRIRRGLRQCVEKQATKK